MDHELDFKTFCFQLTMLLRAQPPGTTADLTDIAVAYWNDGELVCAFVPEKEDDIINDRFDLQLAWYNWRSNLVTWLASPRFTQRASLMGASDSHPTLTNRRCAGCQARRRSRGHQSYTARSAR